MSYFKSAMVYLILFAAIIHGASLADERSPALNPDGSRVNPYLVPRATGAIKVDGALEEEAWQSALKLELRYEFRVGNNVEPPVRTEVLLTYDNAGIYAGFKCYDGNPASIRARLSDRDSINADDYVNIYFDTFNDERSAYGVGSNALGVQMDGIRYHTGRFDLSWDCIFASAGRRYDWGYAVEIALPFDQVRFPRSSGVQVWGLDARRVFPRETTYYMRLNPFDRENENELATFIKIKGFEGARPSRNIEINPTLTGVFSQARGEMPGGAFRTTHKEAEVGVTAKWGATPNITVSGTINPDFSQVEADAWQLDINRPFALYYDETRPFFIEGADCFSSPMISAVYTRALRDPQWGAKVSGKEGANSFGGLFVRDDLTNLIFPGSQYSRSTSLPLPSDAMIFRFKRVLGGGHSLSALLTDREGRDYFNRVFGADGLFRLTRQDRLDFQVLGSSTRYPTEIADRFAQPRGAFTDWATNVRYQHNSSTFFWSAGYWSYGRDFRADLGRVPQTGFSSYSVSFGRQWLPQVKTWFTCLSISGYFHRSDDSAGNLLSSSGGISASYSGPLQSSFYAASESYTQVFAGREYALSGFYISGRARPNAWLYGGMSLNTGDRIDYANAREGNVVSLNSWIEVRPSGHLRLEIDHTLERFVVPGGRLYIANVVQSTLVYQFDARTFLRSIMQYVDYRYNAELYTYALDPEFRQLFTQYLFSYKINPRTVLFLGYGDDYYGGREYGITQADRTVFVKLGYAWQL